MALPPSGAFRQDMPPAGGFSKPPGFPEAGFRKRSPMRGPGGFAMIAGGVGITVFGLIRHLWDVEERNYYNLSRFNAKFERAYVEQAREEVRWGRRQKEALDSERLVMAGVPGWVVGQRRYFTQWEDRPDKDSLDQRRIGPW